MLLLVVVLGLFCCCFFSKCILVFSFSVWVAIVLLAAEGFLSNLKSGVGTKGLNPTLYL